MMLQPGQKKEYSFIVKAHDVARFNGKVVHSVCATFVLAREIEWATRQYVLEVKKENEEGIGTLLEIRHSSPAFVGDQVVIRSEVLSFEGNELICTYKAMVAKRLVAQGRTGQKILKKQQIKEIFSTFE